MTGCELLVQIHAIHVMFKNPFLHARLTDTEYDSAQVIIYLGTRTMQTTKIQHLKMECTNCVNKGKYAIMSL